MAIVSSTYSLGAVQRCGRTPCIELHTDSSGAVHRIEYLANAGTDYATVMAARAIVLLEKLKEDELRYVIFYGEWNYALNHTTANELAAYVRELYKNSNSEQLARIAKRILEWITNGRFTDLQVRNAFGLTAGQWTTLKTKMQTIVANYDAVNSAVGE